MRTLTVWILLLITATASAQERQLSTDSVAADSQSSPEATLKISLLGTGMPPVLHTRFSMATLVEAGKEKFLFDCGRGAAIRLSQLKVPFSEVDKLFITHLHSDHTVGIPDLWLSGWIMGRRESPFRVWGPDGTGNMMSHLEKAFATDTSFRRDVFPRFPGAGISVHARDITEGVVYDDNGVQVRAIRVDHGPFKPAYGYRLDWGDFSVALSGDTKVSENLIKQSKGVDVLIHECKSPQWSANRKDKEHALRIIRTLHTTPEEAGVIFRRVEPRLAVFSHIEDGQAPNEELLSGARKHYSGPMVVGQDLMQISVNADQVVVKQGNAVLFSAK